MSEVRGPEYEEGGHPPDDEAETGPRELTPETLSGPGGGSGILTPSHDSFSETGAHAPWEFETACSPPEHPLHSLMIIEDDAWAAKLLEALLQGAIEAPLGFTHAGSLEDGIRQLSEKRIQLILTDLSLPDSEAGETLSRLREAAPGIPIIVLSGYDKDDLRQQALEAGALAYLVKGSVGNDAILAEIIGGLDALPKLDETTD